MVVDLRKTYNDWYEINLKTKSINVPSQSSAFYQRVLATLRRYNKKKNPKLLDVACGIGHFLQEAKKEGFKIYGVDLSDKAVSQAKKNTQDEIVIGNAEKLPFKANTFDFVTCIGSLEHFSNAEKAVQEMTRVLNPKGVSFLHVPNLMFVGHIYMTLRDGSMPSEGGQQFSENYRTFQGWKKLIGENGMRVVKCDTYNEMFAARKVGLFTRLFWQTLVKYFVPFHLSYAFNFYCKKKVASGKS